MKHFLLFLCFTLLTTSCSKEKTAQWHIINVNYGKLQGDAHILLNGKTVTMIDAGYLGTAKTAVIPYLQHLQIKKIDYFFISHPHRDHYEGMQTLQQNGIPIKNIYYKLPPEGISDCCYDKEHFIQYLNQAKLYGSKLHEVAKGFQLNYPNGASLKVLHAQTTPHINNKKLDVNDMSLIMQWQINGVSTLFTGDLNLSLGTVLADNPAMQSDLLKVPHHGAHSIAPNIFFEQVNPLFAIIPAPTWLWQSERSKQVKTGL